MIFFAYFLVVILLAYRVGRKTAGYGIFVFFLGVFLWQMAVDGPGSLLAHNGCVSYGHAANDC